MFRGIYWAFTALVALASAQTAVQAATFTGLGDLSGGVFSSYAYAVSADGSVVVGQGASASFSTEAFRWTLSGGMVGLGGLPGGGIVSMACGASADGSVVVGYGYNTAYEAFRWTQAGGMIGLGKLSGGTGNYASGSYAYGTSADGSVVVGYTN